MRRFQTLGELIGLYAQPNQGLVCALLLPVEREREPDPPDDRDVSGAAHSATCRCLPCPFPRRCLLLPLPFSQPPSPKAPLLLPMMLRPFTPLPWKHLKTQHPPYFTDSCSQMGRMRSLRCPHVLALPVFLPPWGPAAPQQPLRLPQLQLLRGKTRSLHTEQEFPFLL